MMIPSSIFKWAAASVVVFVYVLAAHTFAQTPPEQTGPPPQTSASLRKPAGTETDGKGLQSIQFDAPSTTEKFWAVTAYGEQYFSDDKFKNFDVSGLNVEAEHRFEGTWEKYFALGGVAGLHYAYGKSQYLFDPETHSADAVGVSLSVVGRVYLFEYDRFSFYVEGLPGVIVFNEDFPPNGSGLNFIGRYGAGMKIKVDENVDVIVGYRHLFIGNGGGYDSSNPTYDGNGFILGAGIKF